MDNHRRLEIHADLSSATPAEIQSLAKTAHEFHRTRDTKTLRDEFAMAALPSVILIHAQGRMPAKVDVAREAYWFADAMMEARKG